MTMITDGVHYAGYSKDNWEQLQEYVWLQLKQRDKHSDNQ
jgi:hypothetical protein